MEGIGCRVCGRPRGCSQASNNMEGRPWEIYAESARTIAFCSQLTGCVVLAGVELSVTKWRKLGRQRLSLKETKNQTKSKNAERGNVEWKRK